MISADGVRYELVRREAEGLRAVYDATVTTWEGVGHARVVIDGDGVTLDGEVHGVSESHCGQMLAIARGLARRAGEGWPRRIHRWRSPGVR